MNALKIILLLVLIIVGLVNRRHVKPSGHENAPASHTQSAVNKDLLQNAERLTETLRHCKETAHKNNETK